MPEYYTPQETAKLLKKTPGWLAAGRSSGRLDLPYIKLSGAVLYDAKDILDWLNRNKHNNTSTYETTPGPGRGHKKVSKK